MLNKAFEWLASQSKPRFKHYRKARLAYEACQPEIGKPFEDLESADYEKWARDVRLSAAEADYRMAIELCRQENALGDLATVLYQQGMLLHLQGRLDDASQRLQASLQLQEGFPQSSRELQALGSGCQYHLGVIAFKRGKLAAAREHLRASLAIDEALMDLQGAMISRRALEKCDSMCRSGDELALDDPAPNGTSENSSAAFPEPPDQGSGGGVSFPPQPSQSPGGSGPPRPARRHRRPSFGEDAVWVLSYSIAANDSMMGLLETFQNDFPRRIMFSRVAFGSGDPSRALPDPIAQDSRLCAAVLVIEPGALENEEFRRWSRWCISAVADRDDFRLFVWLHGMTMEELVRVADRRHHPRDTREASDPAGALADELINTVHIREGASAAELGNALVSYLCDLDDIRAAMHWRRVKLASSVILGRAALAIEVACTMALVAGAIAWAGFERFQWSPGWQLLGRFNADALALVFGIPLFALQTIPLFFLFRGIAASNAILRDDPRLGWWFCGGALLCPASVAVPSKFGASAATIALGIVMGALLDFLRREGLQACRAQVSLDRVYDFVERGGAEFAARALVKPQRHHPLTCPLFPVESPAVFISYRRRSVWSSPVAEWLHTVFRQNKIPSSLDRESIGEGSCWRRALNRFIAEAHVFLILIDERSLHSRWMAAEVMAALAGRHRTNQPEIILLVEPSFLASPRSGGCTVFDALLDEAAKPASPSGIRLIHATESNVRTLAGQLTAHHITTQSLFSLRTLILLNFLLLPFAALGACGVILGVPAIFFAWLQQWEKVDSAAWLLQRGLLTAAILIAGYLCGYAARLAAASRYEVRHDEPKLLASAHSMAAVGFGWLAMVWAAKTPGVVAGWAFVLGCFGWFTAKCFIGGVARAKEDFLREVR